YSLRHRGTGGHMEREVRYCTTQDGVRIAYCVEGEGPTLVIVPTMWKSFSLEYLVPEFQTFNRALGEGRTVIRFDSRGTGLSQLEVEDHSTAALALDLLAVVRATGLSPVSIWTVLQGGLVVVPYVAAHPEQVHRLVLFSTYARAGAMMTDDAWRAWAYL